MEFVKLTDKDMLTYNGYQWAVGEKRTVSGSGELCTKGWLHCYGAETQGQAVLLALLLNPIHADVPYPLRCFSVKCGGRVRSDAGLKFGATEMTLGEELDPPFVTTVNRVAFGILCAMEVVKDRTFVAWGEGWLSGADRSAASAAAVERAAVAVEAAAAARAATARAAAWSAARAARRAVAAAEEAEAAAGSAWSAARAARAVASCGSISLGELAEKSMEVK